MIHEYYELGADFLDVLFVHCHRVLAADDRQLSKPVLGLHPEVLVLGVLTGVPVVVVSPLVGGVTDRVVTTGFW